MSQTKIDLDLVGNANRDLNQSLLKLTNVSHSVASMVYNVDSAIAAQRNIRSRLNQSTHSLHELEMKVKDLLSFINNTIEKYSSTENLLNQKAQSISDKKNTDEGNEWIKLFRNGGIDFSSLSFDSKKRLVAAKELAFQMFRRDGKVFIKIKNGEIANQADFQRYRSLLAEHLGGTSKWKNKFLQNMVNDGVPLYNAESSRFYRSNRNRLSNTQFGELNDYVERLSNTKLKNMSDAFLNTIKDEMKIWDDFTGWKNASIATKSGKFLGALGNVLTVGENYNDNFYNKDTKEREYTGEHTKKFVVDTAVDLGTGAAAMAAGAAIGSFFLPPAGTIVGAVAGAVINFGLNVKFIGDPPESIVQKTKDFVNEKVDQVTDLVEDVAGQLGKKLNSIFW